MKKFLAWVVVAALVAFVAYRPASAAATTKALGVKVLEVGSGVGDFFTRLVS